jgi:hypothetical protein
MLTSQCVAEGIDALETSFLVLFQLLFATFHLVLVVFDFVLGFFQLATVIYERVAIM